MDMPKDVISFKKDLIKYCEDIYDEYDKKFEEWCALDIESGIDGLFRHQYFGGMKAIDRILKYLRSN